MLMQDAHTIQMKGVLIGMIAFIYLITFFRLRASTRLVKILGETGNNVMIRLMGLILMVMAVECFVSGVKPILVDILKMCIRDRCNDNPEVPSRIRCFQYGQHDGRYKACLLYTSLF